MPLSVSISGHGREFYRRDIFFSKQQNIKIRDMRLILNNYYTMKGSMLKRTMVGGAENIELEVEIDRDLDDEPLLNF